MAIESKGEYRPNDLGKGSFTLAVPGERRTNAIDTAWKSPHEAQRALLDPQVRASVKEAHRSKVVRVAQLMHDYRKAQAPIDEIAGATLERAAHDEEFRGRLQQIDWHQAESLVNGVNGDEQIIIEHYQRLIQKADTTSTLADKVAQAFYDRRIAFNPSDANLPSEEAARLAKNDWQDALRWLKYEVAGDADREQVEQYIEWYQKETAMILEERAAGNNVD